MVTGKSKIYDERKNPSGTKNNPEWGQIRTGGEEGKEKEKITEKFTNTKYLYIHCIFI